MKNILPYLALIGILGAEPADLTKNRETFHQKQEEIKILYINWLEKRIRESSEPEKGQYQKELDGLVKVEDTPSNLEVVDGKPVYIDSKKGMEKIGKLEKGDKILIQYESGIWTSYPDWLKESPENPRVRQHRLHFVVRDGDIEKVDIPLIDTAKNPFVYVMESDGEVFLIMEGINILTDNDGVVKYQVEIRKNKN